MDAARSRRGQRSNARELQHDHWHVGALAWFVSSALCHCVSRVSPFALDFAELCACEYTLLLACMLASPGRSSCRERSSHDQSLNGHVIWGEAADRGNQVPHDRAPT